MFWLLYIVTVKGCFVLIKRTSQIILNCFLGSLSKHFSLFSEMKVILLSSAQHDDPKECLLLYIFLKDNDL